MAHELITVDDMECSIDHGSKGTPSNRYSTGKSGNDATPALIPSAYACAAATTGALVFSAIAFEFGLQLQTFHESVKGDGIFTKPF